MTSTKPFVTVLPHTEEDNPKKADVTHFLYIPDELVEGDTFEDPESLNVLHLTRQDALDLIEALRFGLEEGDDSRQNYQRNLDNNFGR